MFCVWTIIISLSCAYLIIPFYLFLNISQFFPYKLSKTFKVKITLVQTHERLSNIYLLYTEIYRNILLTHNTPVILYCDKNWKVEVKGMEILNLWENLIKRTSVSALAFETIVYRNYSRTHYKKSILQYMMILA